MGGGGIPQNSGRVALLHHKAQVEDCFEINTYSLPRVAWHLYNIMVVGYVLSVTRNRNKKKHYHPQRLSQVIHRWNQFSNRVNRQFNLPPVHRFGSAVNSGQ